VPSNANYEEKKTQNMPFIQYTFCYQTNTRYFFKRLYIAFACDIINTAKSSNLTHMNFDCHKLMT